MEKGKMVGTLYIDLPRHLIQSAILFLFWKWDHVGSRELHCIGSWTTFYRFMMCEIDGQRSEPRPITCGLPQGSILGPILFLIYFTDSKKCLNHSKVINLADDTVIYLSRKKYTDIEKSLNEDLQKIFPNFSPEMSFSSIWNQEKQSPCSSVLGKT